MKTKLLLILILTFLAFESEIAQINSVTFSGIVSSTFQKKDKWEILSTNGVGVEIDAKFDLYKNLKLKITGGYQEFSISQNVFALFAEYNWKYWKRYYGDINDPNFIKSTQWVQSILKDSTYSASFNPVQKMDLFPVTVTIAYEFFPFQKLILRPFIGGGVLFYQKRLYVEETWKKKFAALDNYVYGYTFRDMDNNVNGYPFTATVGLDIEYSLGTIVNITGGLKYCQVFYSGNSSYDNFPMKDVVSFKLGLGLMY